jgi:hypothetical protein
MVLVALAARSTDKGLIINLPISELCKDANATDRTVKSAIAELRDELKEITTEGGRGRGQHFDFDLSPLLEKVKILHASDKGAEISPIETKGEDIAPIPADKGEIITEIGADISPLSDPKGEDFTGTPVAPSKDKELLTTSGAKAPSARARVNTPAVELPDWLPPDSWHEWEEHRREIKKPLTALSVKKQIKQLADYRARGMPPEKVIEEAITHGWRGFYPLKDESHEAAQSGTNGNGRGRTQQTERPHDASRRGAPQDRTPPGGWGFKNGPGG